MIFCFRSFHQYHFFSLNLLPALFDGELCLGHTLVPLRMALIELAEGSTILAHCLLKMLHLQRLDAISRKPEFIP